MSKGNMGKGLLSKFLIISLSLSPIALAPSANAESIDLTKTVVLSSENISTHVANGALDVHLNIFRPNNKIFFKVTLGNTETTTVSISGSKLELPKGGTFQFSVTSGETLDPSVIKTPIREVLDQSGSSLIKVFAAPEDLPVISFSGDTSLVNKRQMLTTPVTASGTYALATIGNQIRFFQHSPNNLIGFRKITDAPLKPGTGGLPTYAYLEQKDFGVTATSPGLWRLLDANFNTLEKINDVQTKFGILPSEGHGMTTSPAGNAVVITTPTRQVDSSWLKRQYKLPILDCDIAEVRNGKAIREFSWWDWSVAHKNISGPLLDAMQLFNDPQNPVSSPIDICHANSLEYYKPLNVYLLSLRSPSSLIILSADLKNVKSVLTAPDALQHFARFASKTEITALGNYTFGKNSKFLSFKLIKGKWVLNELTFPTIAEYCGNANYLDKTHVWLGGGCGAFIPGVMGAIYKIEGKNLVEVGRVKADPFIYTYRADVLEYK